MLAPLLEPERFLSDFGYGVDPVIRWRDRGTEPLEALETLLNILADGSWWFLQESGP
jgi:hypothetical protein